MHKNVEYRRKNVQTIHIKRIYVDNGHIRRNIRDIRGLKETIADAGLLQPILVQQAEHGYKVIDGARRLEALKALEVQELIIGKDVIVDDEETEADFKFKQLIANVQREDINDIELGHAFVVLKEKYGYQYKEIAEIIGKTPHYVAAKVGLAKRLIPEVQELVVKNWEAAKCIRDTLKEESGDAEEPYSMNVKIIEDIARLPAELQRASYEFIRDKEMDTGEALRYLRKVKVGLEEARAEEDAEEAGLEVKKYLEKIYRDVDKLSVTIKSSPVVDNEKVASTIEELITRLNLLYMEVKAGSKKSTGVATDL